MRGVRLSVTGLLRDTYLVTRLPRAHRKTSGVTLNWIVRILREAGHATVSSMRGNIKIEANRFDRSPIRSASLFAQWREGLGHVRLAWASEKMYTPGSGASTREECIPTRTAKDNTRKKRKLLFYSQL